MVERGRDEGLGMVQRRDGNISRELCTRHTRLGFLPGGDTATGATAHFSLDFDGPP